VNVATLLKLAVAAAIVVSTYYAILEIAEAKADGLAGRETFVLDARSGPEAAAFAELLGRLRAWGEDELAASLATLRDSGQIRVAPRLGGGRSAVYVNALGLVKRIYLRPDDLVVRRLPFPDLDVPERAQRTYAAIRLAGTLVHELQHYEGVEDENAAYEREIEWYHELGDRAAEVVVGDARPEFVWALASALASAEAAREKAVHAS
jgi:hypothetical protein